MMRGAQPVPARLARVDRADEGTEQRQRRIEQGDVEHVRARARPAQRRDD
jgi:hypothetical protein